VNGVNPYLNFDGNAEEAFQFYRSVFGGEIVVVLRIRDMGGGPPGTPESELDRETIEVGASTFPTLRLEPHVWKVGQGLEPRLRGATIWVSEGAVRVPVRIRSDVFIGSVNVALETK